MTATDLRALRWIVPAAILALAFAVAARADRRQCLAPDGAPLPVAMLAPDTLSTDMDEVDAALAPSGDELVLTVRSPWTAPGAQRVLLHSRCVGGRWSAPRVMLDLGSASAMSPVFTADGERLLFARRDTTPDRPAYHLWSARRDARAPEGWRPEGPWAPELAGPGNDYSPAITADGTLYFISDRAGIAGGQNVLRSNPPYRDATLVDSSLAGADGVDVSADGRMMVLAMPWRDDALRERGVWYGRADLYVRRRARATDPWGALRRIERPGVNSPATEGAPRLLRDGRLLFSSERGFVTASVNRIADRQTLLRALRRSGNGLGDLYVTRSPLDSTP